MVFDNDLELVLVKAAVFPNQLGEQTLNTTTTTTTDKASVDDGDSTELLYNDSSDIEILEVSAKYIIFS